MSLDYFSSNKKHFLTDFDQTDANVNRKITLDEVNTILTKAEKQLKKFNTKINNSTEIIHILFDLYTALKLEKTNELVSTIGFSILDSLLPLVNSENLTVQHYSYLCLINLTDQLDQDELTENMMGQLICTSWDLDNSADLCLESARLSAVYFELFGKGLQKMSRARDWMLYIPFLSNYITKTVDTIHTILKEKSVYFCYKLQENSPSKWDQIILLTINNFLDFILFIHERTVNQEISEFPYNSIDIGLENGDTKRRYLGYYLLNLIFDQVISHFDMQLSKTYYELHLKFFHDFDTSLDKDKDSAIAYFKLENMKPMFDIVQRCLKISKRFGFTPSNVLDLQTSLMKNKKLKSRDDELYDNDRQMINSSLYPLNFDGIATLLSLSIYEEVLYPSIYEENNSSKIIDERNYYEFAKKFVTILLSLVSRPSDCISRTDKGIFVMLYTSNQIKASLTMKEVNKMIPGYFGGQSEFPVSGIIMMLSSVASTSPDDCIRFLSFKLIEKFLDFGIDEVKVFFLMELIDRCPYPSMNTAAIGLLKKYIRLASPENGSLFNSPLIVESFFPVIYKFKKTWKERNETFWSDYNYIMEALSLYFFILKSQTPFLMIWIRREEEVKSMKKNYLEPLATLIKSLDPLKVSTMDHMIVLINEAI